MCPVTLRPLAATFAFVSIAFSQDLPSFRWASRLDASGQNTSVAGVGTDSQGNVYVAGTTSTLHFPVKNALQPVMAAVGLYRINGSSSTPLGLARCSSLALDPQNPAQIYAVSNGALLKSLDSGATFNATTLSSDVYSVAIEPGNDQVIYAGSHGKGVLKSVDGGATWVASNNGLQAEKDGTIPVQELWIDPANVQVIFARVTGVLMRSGDGAANWQPIPIADTIEQLAFDPANGVVYVSAARTRLFRSSDYGQTFTPVTTPRAIGQIVPDPMQPGRLIGIGGIGIYQSTDGGANWTQESGAAVSNLIADSVNGIYYALQQGEGIVRISSDLQSVTPVSLGPPSSNVRALAAVNGQVYAASIGGTNIFVARLDPSGNLIYATYLGGSGEDSAAAMAVDAAGNVFVTGTTNSVDFPVSKGAYAPSGNVFLTRINPDGSLGYSTYFSGTIPVAVATDGNGSAWLLGNSQGQLPVTPGALSSDFCCALPGVIFVGPPIIPMEASLTRFSPSGSSLTFSTYIPGSGVQSALGISEPASAFALAPDGSAYIGGFLGVFHVDAAGSTLLASTDKDLVTPQAITLGPDGTVYVAGAPFQFQATPGAFQTTASEAGIVRFDAALSNVLAATSFGSSSQVKVMTADAAGNVYLGGSTSIGLPTRTPFAGAFAGPTGFLSKLSGDLSRLLFSSYFGDTHKFTVSGVGIGQNGDVLIGGMTNLTNYTPGQGDVWLNSLALTAPPALRIDSVVNAASLLDYPISAGEAIVVRGAGFGDNTQLLIDGTPVSPISITPTAITLTAPAVLPEAVVTFEVRSGGGSSNSVMMPVALTSPGVFSQNGSGLGQGYIVNKDGTLNSPSNPARPGDKITIFATGVGPMTFTQCCAVTDFPVNVFIDRIYCDGVAAINGPVSGLPGNVYQITVYVPDPAVVFAGRNPAFTFPPLSPLTLQINGVSSPDGIMISIAQ